MTETTASHRLCLAPMMDWSDRFCRMFWRQLTRQARLYTEMVTTAALLKGPADRLLAFSPAEQPLALQIGGSEPSELARCAALAEAHGFAEVNLNCGCPSDRVQSGAFGACLMAEPARVAAGIQAMRDACTLPVTVKHRIGIDDQDSEQALTDFVGTLMEAGCETIIVHARKAWLQGLSPKENRDIPPLDYPRVYRLKKQFPELTIILNGGLADLDACQEPLQQVDGVMLGRAAYHNPWILAKADSRLFGCTDPALHREDALRSLYPYIEQELKNGTRLHLITRHLLGLYLGQPGGRAFRRHLSLHANRPGASLEVVEAALSARAEAAERSSHRLSALAES